MKIKIKNEEKSISVDEHPRAGTSVESLKKLRPAFDNKGTITAGNASGINDGAALLMLTSLKEARTRHLKPMVRIASWAQIGCEPMLMGVAPIQAIQLAVRLFSIFFSLFIKAHILNF